MQYLRKFWSNSLSEHQVLVLVLFLGLIIGIIFIHLVPPWQHYDEPTHYEYAWLVANRPGLPAKGDYDHSMRRAVAASMVEYEFFNNLGFTPNLISSVESAWIGFSQTGSNPLYYWLASMPLRLLRTSDVTFQLYVLRYVSLLFFLVTVVAAYGIAAELSPRGHPLRWLLPITILLLPGFVDILTAVNDDVGATMFFSLFLWVGIKLHIRGFIWSRLVIFLILAIICFFTKNTVMVATILVVIPVLFSIVRGSKKKFAWIALGAFVILIGLVMFSWGDASTWYRTTRPSSFARSTRQVAPHGEQVFELSVSQEVPRSQVAQLLPPDGGNSRTYTIGAWIWADRPVTVRLPILRSGGKSILKEVEVSTEPEFFSITGDLSSPDQSRKISLSLITDSLESVILYYDGIIVLEGTWPDDSIPKFNDQVGINGNWGGKDFRNLVRNPSAEIAGLGFRGWVETLITKYFPGNPSIVLGLVLDPKPLISYYTITLKSLFQTFWARFGWAHVVLVGIRPYTILGLFSLVGVIGAMVAIWRTRLTIRWDVVLFLGLALFTVWGAAFLRGLTITHDGGYFIPVARYAYPAIIPSMLVLNIGWLEVIRRMQRILKIPQKYLLITLMIFFILLDLLSIYSIYRFYYL